jgi:hypothetical protein
VEVEWNIRTKDFKDLNEIDYTSGNEKYSFSLSWVDEKHINNTVKHQKNKGLMNNIPKLIV